VVLVLDWNVTRRARNRGSAIFMHLTRPDGGPTHGCIALDPKLVRRLLPQLLAGITIRVLP
jgi:L,D-peptidoglycan transpeptidase YkuD (ErfK/YbiS/YcfS/YnhG family)